MAVQNSAPPGTLSNHPLILSGGLMLVFPGIDHLNTEQHPDNSDNKDLKKGNDNTKPFAKLSIAGSANLLFIVHGSRSTGGMLEETSPSSKAS